MMSAVQLRGPARALAILCCLLLTAGGCATVPLTPGGAPAGEQAGELENIGVSAEVFVDTTSGKFVLVDLDTNELSFMHGDDVLWRAPVGTGTGLQLRSEDGDEWEFSTPRGV